MHNLALAIGSVGIVIIGGIAGVVVRDLWTGKIDLTKLLSGDDAASLSRFQFLIFTFIIGLSYLYVAVDAQTLPDVQNAWALLGISGGSYVLGKGIQISADTAVKTQEHTTRQAEAAARQAQAVAEQSRLAGQQPPPATPVPPAPGQPQA
jgi:hypothetical protein